MKNDSLSKEELLLKIEKLEHDLITSKNINNTLVKAEEQTRFQTSLLNAVEQAVVVTNPDGEITFWNPFAEQVYGWTAKEVMGRNIIEITVPQVSQSQGAEIMVQLGAGKSWSGEFLVNHRNGKTFPVFITDTPILNDKGELIGIIGISYDITERKQAEETLVEHENLLAKAESISNQGSWKWDIVNDKWSFSDNWLKIHGTDHSGISRKELMKIAHPDDFSTVEKAMTDAIDNKVPYSLEHRIIRKDNGKVRFIQALGEVHYSNDGKPEYMNGVARDITDRKQAEEALKESEEKFKSFFNTDPSATFVWKAVDGDFILSEVNEASQEITGGRASNFIGMRASDIYHDLPFMIEKLNECLESKKVIEFEHYYKNRNQGTFDWIEFRLAFVEPDVILLYSNIVTARKQAEEELKNSQKTLISALESMTDAVFISDVNGGFIHFNDTFATFHRLKDKSECAIALMDWTKIIEVYNLDGTVLPFDRWVVNRAINGEQSSHEEYILKRKDTGEKWYGSYNYSPIRDENGTIIGSVVVASDITEKKQAEQALLNAKIEVEENEAKYRLLYENAGLGIGYISPEGNIISFNAIAANDMNGVPEDFAGKSIFDIFPEDAAAVYSERLQKAANSDEIEVYEDYVQLPVQEKWFLSTYVRIVNSRNKVLGIQIISQDITNIKQAEVELIKAKEKAEENEEKFKLLNHLTSEMLLLPDIESIYKFISETLRKYYPNTLVITVSIDEAIQKAKLEAVSGLENSLIKKIIKISGFNPFDKTYKLIDFHRNYFKSGNFVEFNGGVAKFADSEFPEFAAKTIEKLIGVYKIYSIGINKDDELLAAVHFLTYNKQVIAEGNFIEVFVKQAGLVLQKKTNEKALKNAKEQAEASNANITAIIEGTNSSIWAFNRSYELLYINNTFQQEFLQSFGVLLQPGMNLVEALPEMLQPFWKPRYDRVLNNEQFTLEDAVPTDIGTLYIEVTFNPIVKNGQVIGGSCFGSNITSRKLAELELQKAKEKAEESEMQLKLIADNFVNGMIYQVAMLDENRRQFNYISKNVEELYGCTMQEAKEDANLIYGKIHPDDINGLIEKEKKALKNMSVFETEARTIMPDGNIRWAYYISKPRVINGIVCWDGIEIDITERKQMELELVAAKEKAEESDRLKSAFLANMSHEIRTPMNGILGFTNLLKEPGLTGKDKKKFIDIIERSGDRMLNTVNDIIDISKIEAGQVDVVISEINLNKQLNELFEFFLPEATKKNIKLSVIKGVADQQARFISDKEKLNSIFTNFIKNAIKYTPAGSIEFGYTIKESDEQNELKFYVKDTGIGISKERQDAVFGRFIQADIEDKQAYEGSGLGLAISKAYVEMLGGKIWVESEEGVGSQFYFTIPYKTNNKEIPKKNTDDSNKQLPLNKGLKILIVEDDEFALTHLCILLEEYAKETLIAKTGIEAVEICRANRDIDVILMDIKIPGINGYEATRQIREFSKDVFILAQTAYAQSGDREKSIQAGCNDYISKPIDKEKLLGIISNRF